MADLWEALNYILQNEGGYSNDPADHGGETNYGITQSTLNNFNKFHSEYGLPDNVKRLTVRHVAIIYRVEYWKFDGVENQRVATKLFDMAVNMGPIQAIRLAQEAVGVAKDGRLGPITLEAINSSVPDEMLSKLVNECVNFYNAIMKRDPTQEKFRKGWMRRAKMLPVDQQDA